MSDAERDGRCNHKDGFSHCSECCDESNKRLEAELKAAREQHADYVKRTASIALDFGAMESRAVLAEQQLQERDADLDRVRQLASDYSYKLSVAQGSLDRVGSEAQRAISERDTRIAELLGELSKCQK